MVIIEFLIGLLVLLGVCTVMFSFIGCILWILFKLTPIAIIVLVITLIAVVINICAEATRAGREVITLIKNRRRK